MLSKAVLAFWGTKNVKVLIEIQKNKFLFINIVYLMFILSRSSLSLGLPTLHKNEQ